MIDLEQIRARHRPVLIDPGFCSYEYDGMEPWPCDSVRLIEAMDALTTAQVVLICHECKEPFSETVAAIVAANMVAPTLCAACGH